MRLNIIDKNLRGQSLTINVTDVPIKVHGAKVITVSEHDVSVRIAKGENFEIHVYPDVLLFLVGSCEEVKEENEKEGGGVNE